MSTAEVRGFEMPQTPEREECDEIPKDNTGRPNSTKSQPIRSIVIDTRPLLFGMLSERLAEQSDIEVVAHLNSLEDLASLPLLGCRIDVVVLHVAHVNHAAETTIRAITNGDYCNIQPHVLVLSASESDNDLLAGIRSGARGYVSNDAELTSFFMTVRMVANGGVALDASVASRLPALFRAGHGSPSAAETSLLARLTDRERDIVLLLAEGRTNRSIGRELLIGERTVRNHLTQIFLKLGVRDRLQAALVAREFLQLQPQDN